jgi:uncharacterized protein YrrD
MLSGLVSREPVRKTIAMIYQTKEFEGYEIKARDGVLGSVKDLYFDDQRWSIRYFIVATGSWLNDRRVLLPATRLAPPESNARTLSIDATQEQVKNSPPIEWDRPVSRQHERALHDYFGWPYYWGVAPLAGGGIGTMAAVGATPVPPPSLGSDKANASHSPPANQASERHSEDDPHLRSVREVRGYHIAARDGAIGEVEDFLVEAAGWEVRYLLVDTRKWLPGRKVIVSPNWIRAVSWEQSQVAVDLSRDEIKNGPPYDPARPLTESYTDRLFAYYGTKRPRSR